MTTATFDTSEGTFKVKLYDDKAPKTVANFVGLATGTQEWTDPKTGQKVSKPVLRRPDLPPRHRRLHDPGRLPDGQRHGRPRLQVRATSSARACATTATACCRWPTPARTPTAASSSSRWRRRRGSTTSTPSSARSPKAWTSSAPSARPRTGAQDRPAKEIVVKSVKIEKS